MELLVDFPGGLAVNAHFGTHTIPTDQPVAAGGTDAAPSPFILFLASLGTCAGFYVLSFCRQRGLATDGIRVLERIQRDNESGLVGQIDIEIQVPPDFPAKYHDALVRAADHCTVKKHLEAPPQIHTFTRVV